MVVSASSSTSKVCIDGKSENFMEKIVLLGWGGRGGGSMPKWADVAFVIVLLQSPPVCEQEDC